MKIALFAAAILGAITEGALIAHGESIHTGICGPTSLTQAYWIIVEAPVYSFLRDKVLLSHETAYWLGHLPAFALWAVLWYGLIVLAYKLMRRCTTTPIKPVSVKDKKSP